jgi:hypothetical protein
MRSTELCPECARPTDAPGARGRTAACPHCGTPLDRAEATHWTNVARVTNLAEAGFLVDELSGEGIDARIYQTDDFSALADRWLVSYLIQSPPQDAQAAAARIRQHLAEIESYQDPAAAGAWPEERPGIDPLLWRPVALAILAGVASFALGQRFAADRDPPRPPRDSLATAVAALGRPLVSEPAAGLPRHRLYYHLRERAWHLDTDADGDGRFETRQRFHATGAGW